ncbi:hypothetical protein GCM10009737_13610 [Nocardioides lentus]|uniref:Uncharacterized protein n=1 Tax=Nocardioides lentus TaxID=338077 RepID=A0ABP5AGK4_9ACTN
MTITKRRLAAFAAPALLAASLTACGAGGPPADASEDDFCAAYNGPLEDAISSSIEEGGEPDGTVIYDAVQDQATQLEETGTPEGVSDEQREGFEIYVDTITSVSEDDFVAAIEEGEEPDETADLSDEDEDRVNDFTDYASETCGEPAAG